MHPKISRLYINNYRCFVNFELRPEGRMLLLGYNGTGKSSILDVLAAIQDVVIWNKDVADLFPPDCVSAFADSKEQRIELDIESEWGTFRYALHLTHDNKRNIALIASETVTLGGQPLYHFENGEVQLYRDDFTPTKASFSFSPRRSFLASLEPETAHKWVPKSMDTKVAWLKTFIEGIWILRFNPDRMSAVSQAEDTFLARDASNFGSWCRNLLSESPDNVQRAREMLKEIVPGFESLRTQTVGRAKVLVVKFSYPGGAPYELDFDSLSDGQKVLIALYMILHGVAPRPTVLGLDEPDNFVSIREIQPFLVELTRLSGNTGLQALLISHSAEVIDFIGASDAILLERPDGAHTRVASIVSDPSLRLSELMARGWHAAA
jgi:predicted ATPase